MSSKLTMGGNKTEKQLKSLKGWFILFLSFSLCVFKPMPVVRKAL